MASKRRVDEAGPFGWIFQDTQLRTIEGQAVVDSLRIRIAREDQRRRGGPS